MDNQTNNDQAKQLRQTVKQNSDRNKNSTKLPPRSAVHKDKKKITKFKIKYPVIRLLALIFVLIPIFILSYMYQNKDEFLKTNAPKQYNENHDTIDFAENSKFDLEEDEENSKAGEESSKTESMIENEDVKTTAPPEDSEESPSGSSTSDINTSTTKTSSLENQKVNYTIKYHKVKENETLFSISIQYYKSRDGEQLIREWNNLDQTKIFEGQVLKIPIKDKTGK